MGASLGNMASASSETEPTSSSEINPNATLDADHPGWSLSDIQQMKTVLKHYHLTYEIEMIRFFLDEINRLGPRVALQRCMQERNVFGAGDFTAVKELLVEKADKVWTPEEMLEAILFVAQRPLISSIEEFFCRVCRDSFENLQTFQTMCAEMKVPYAVILNK